MNKLWEYIRNKLDDKIADFLIKNIDIDVNNKEQINLLYKGAINYMKDNKSKSSKEIKNIIKETERKIHINKAKMQ